MSKNHETEKVVNITEVQNMEPQENPTPDEKPEVQKTEDPKKCVLTRAGEWIDSKKQARKEKRENKKAEKAENQKEKKSDAGKTALKVGLAIAAFEGGKHIVKAYLNKKLQDAEDSETETEGEETEETDPGAPTEE